MTNKQCTCNCCSCQDSWHHACINDCTDKRLPKKESHEATYNCIFRQCKEHDYDIKQPQTKTP